MAEVKPMRSLRGGCEFIRIAWLVAGAVLAAGMCAAAETDWVVETARKTVTLSGYTRGKTTMTVSSEVSGRMLKVAYDVGETIGKAPFFEIDPTFVDFQIESTRESLKKVDTALKLSESRIEYLKKEFERIEKLHKEDGAAGVQRDAAEEDLDQARLSRIGTLAEKGLLEVALNELMERRRRHRIMAPEGWVVIEKKAETGEMVAPGAPLAVVGDYRTLVIPLAVSSEEISAIQALPDRFEVSVEGRKAPARINWINPRFNAESRKLDLELALVDHAGPHRGGLRAELTLDMQAPGIRVPKEAVINRYENPRVVVASTKEIVPLMVLGETDGHLIVADNDRLPPGTRLGAQP